MNRRRFAIALIVVGIVVCVVSIWPLVQAGLLLPTVKVKWGNDVPLFTEADPAILTYFLKWMLLASVGTVVGASGLWLLVYDLGK